MHHKMLVEIIVEQDGGRSLVGTKDEQKKRLIAAALNNKKNKESRRTCITPKKIRNAIENGRRKKLRKDKEQRRKEKLTGWDVTFCFKNPFIFYRDKNNSYLKAKKSKFTFL